MSRARNKRAVRREERYGPTPETLAKLQADPLLGLLQGQDTALERAADEIHDVFMAVCRSVMPQSREIGGFMAAGKYEIADHLALAHAETYLPWANENPRGAIEATIDLIIDRRSQAPFMAAPILRALHDYAKRMGMRKSS